MSLIEIYRELAATQSVDEPNYIVASIPGSENHRIGVVNNGQPAFFIRCQETKGRRSLNVSLALLRVEYSLECELITIEGRLDRGYYTIISLKSNVDDFRSYFIETVMLIIERLTSLPTIEQLSEEVDKLIKIFTALSSPPKKTIQGLWAELLLIATAYDPTYLLKSWHISKNDRFDFNDGTDKIEVKSTTNTRRIHHFSYEQLKPNKGSDLLIVSIFVIQTGIGKNIFDLTEDIERKISDPALRFKVRQTLAETIGSDLEKAADLYFDFNQAIDSIAFFNANAIQTFDVQVIPSAMENISFDYDLTELSKARKKSSSKLHTASCGIHDEVHI